LRLGFIGKDWKRKGLPLLVEVAEKLKSRNIDTRIIIIGNSPPEFKEHPLVEDLGFIDKTNEPDKFINAVASCDLGCIFSPAEALGISALEFLFCQVPVAGFYHQGMIDTLIEDASIRFKPTDTTDYITDTIELMVNDQNLSSDLHRNAKSISRRVTWDACVEKWRGIIQ
jgi:glycosyltransferase involved in cell wall biosynthesis